MTDEEAKKHLNTLNLQAVHTADNIEAFGITREQWEAHLKDKAHAKLISQRNDPDNRL